MIDPRVSLIQERLAPIDRIIAVTGGKGGIGKTVIASTLGVILKNRGLKVGLCDLDLCGPSTHIVLGGETLYPEEEKGIVPPNVYGIQYLSIVFFAKDFATPLRGTDISNAIIELLAITRWDKLDVLLFDMPPGLSDAALDTIRFIPHGEYLIVTTGSKLSWVTTRKIISFLKELNLPIIGVIENLANPQEDFIQSSLKEFNIKYLGKIPIDPELEKTFGNPQKLLQTKFAKELDKIAEKFVR